jgi:pantetheine-phosphate adenylyltransferase
MPLPRGTGQYPGQYYKRLYNMSRNALYAGSFDPVTNGHLNIIKRAAGIFDTLTVSVVVNPGKNCMFTVDERLEILKEVTRDIPNVRVDKFSGLLADYVNENGFTAVVRGLRATMDFENEIAMAQMNSLLYNKGTETIFLMTDPQYSFISSSIIREVMSLGGSIDTLVPEYVINRMRDKLQEENK